MKYRHGEVLLEIEKVVKRTIRGTSTEVCILKDAATGEHFGEIPKSVADRCLVPVWQSDEAFIKDVEDFRKRIYDPLPQDLIDLFDEFYNELFRYIKKYEEAQCPA